MADPFITVAGAVGAGKSTVVSALSRQLGYAGYMESAAERNPFLQDFYADKSRFAFRSQTFFLLESLHQMHDIASLASGALQDRSIWEQIAIFGGSLSDQGHLSKDEFALLSEIGELATRQLPAPI